MKRPRVYITCPNGGAWIHKLVHFRICQILGDRRIIPRHDCPTHSPYVDNLHACMNDFLDNGDDYWLSMDDDNPPQGNPIDLVDLDLDLVGFPTPVWHSAVPGDRPWYFNALTKVGEEGYKPLPAERCKGLQEVDAIGSGCFMVSRRVMLKLRHNMPFMRGWDQKTGRVIKGGDYSFCDKVKEAGFRIWASFDHICDHFNELSLLETINAFGAMCEAGNDQPQGLKRPLSTKPTLSE